MTLLDDANQAELFRIANRGTAIGIPPRQSLTTARGTDPARRHCPRPSPHRPRATEFVSVTQADHFSRSAVRSTSFDRDGGRCKRDESSISLGSGLT
jgi:hypothetical protein